MNRPASRMFRHGRATSLRAAHRSRGWDWSFIVGAPGQRPWVETARCSQPDPSRPTFSPRPGEAMGGVIAAVAHHSASAARAGGIAAVFEAGRCPLIRLARQAAPDRPRPAPPGSGRRPPPGRARTDRASRPAGDHRPPGSACRAQACSTRSRRSLEQGFGMTASSGTPCRNRIAASGLPSRLKAALALRCQCVFEVGLLRPGLLASSPDRPSDDERRRDPALG
jgi:hypothetical protein